MKKILFFFTFVIVLSSNKVQSQDFTVLWQNFYGEDSYDYVNAMELTSDGGLVLAGETHSLSGNPQATVRKIDASGNLQWEKSIGGAGTEEFKSVKQTPDGGYILVGYLYTVNTSNDDMWVHKIDASGNTQWSVSFYAYGIGELTSVIVTSDGNFVILGSESDDNNGDFFIRKLDTSGNTIWTKSYGGSAAEHPAEIIQTADNGFMVVGTTSSSDGDVVGHLGGADIWVIKLNQNGFLEWQRVFGGSMGEIVASVIQSDDGDYVIAGSSDSNDFDLAGATDVPGDNSYDFWVVKFGEYGDITWQKSIGDPTWDQKAYSVIQSLGGSYVVAGESNDSSRDAYIVKINNSGQIETELNYSSIPNSSGDFVRSIRQTENGEYFLAGYSSGNNPNLDAWLVKLTDEVLEVTNIPDDNFESYLEANGMGNGISGDNLVFTSSIENVTYLDVINKNISDLTGIEDFTALETLNCSNNYLTSLNLTQNLNLTNLYFSNNTIEAIDISSNANLEYLDCSYNQISSVDLIQNLNLLHLNVSNNELNLLDVSLNPGLLSLDCTGNNLVELNTTENPALFSLYASNNDLKNIDLSQNMALESLYCLSNQLTFIDLGQNSLISNLNISDNQILDLDINNLGNLLSLDCSNNDLYRLNLNNGNNSNLYIVNSQNNPNLTCIKVDNENGTNLMSWQKDATANFKENCDSEPITWEIFNEWSNLTGPMINNDVFIIGNLTQNSNLEAKDIILNTYGRIEILSDYTFTLSGKIINYFEPDQFIIQSGGNLLQTNQAVENTGAIKVQRNSQPMYRLDYTMWSSPVSGQGLIDFSPYTINGITNHIGLEPRIYIYDGNNGYVNPDPFEIDTEFNAGLGYLVRSPNNWVSSGEGQAYEGSFIGTPFNGSVTIPVVAGNYTSIGNPYPSNIDANELMNLNPNIQSLYFWNNPERFYNDDTETYEYNGTSYVAYTSGTGSVPFGTFNGFVSVGQGFIVSSTSSQVSFENSLRVDDSALFLKMNENEKNRYWISLENENQEELNQILIGYIEGASNSVDLKMDAKSFGYEGSSLYMLIDEEDFVIQGRAYPFQASDRVPLGFKAMEDGKFIISLINLEGLFLGNETQIYLVDHHLNLIHNLMESAYEFESNEGIFKNRFEILYQNEEILSNDESFLNEIKIYQFKDEVVVRSDDFISDIEVYNLQGLIIYQFNSLDKKQFSFKHNRKEILILIITLKNGNQITKKIIYQ